MSNEWIKIGAVADCPPGSRLYHEFEYDTVIVLNVDGSFYCIADLCSHDEGSLEDGPLMGCEIKCPRHGARFDVRTGKATQMPAVEPIPTFAVKIIDDDIWVEGPDEEW